MSTSNNTSAAFVRSHLDPQEGSILLSIKEFFSVGKSRRKSKTFKALLGTVSVPTDAGTIRVYITMHQLSLYRDVDYTKCQHLRRGHIIEKHYILFPDGQLQVFYQEFGAHPKFANLDQYGFDQARSDYLRQLDSTTVETVYLHEKVSGSMCIAVFPQQTYTIATIAGTEYSYRHPRVYYVTSKNGYDNEYSQAGKKTLVNILSARGYTAQDLMVYLHSINVESVVFELMKFEEHVFLDTDEDLYVHLLGTQPIRLVQDYLPTVRTVGIFNTPGEAIARWQQDNDGHSHMEGYVMTVVLKNAAAFKVKLKFWNYLLQREFREIIKANICPTKEQLLIKYDLWAVPKDQRARWAQASQDWFWYVQSCPKEQADKLAAGRFIAIRDAFLATSYDRDTLVRAAAQSKSVVVILLLTGVQCSGKSFVRSRIEPWFRGFSRSQDECGGKRANLIAEYKKWAATCTNPGLYVAIIDRCNLDPEQRRILLTDLAKTGQTAFILPVNVVIKGSSKQVAFNKLFERFLQRPDHESFSPTSVGTIKGLEILRANFSNYQPVLAESAESAGINESKLVFETLLARAPLDLFITNQQRVKTSKQPAIPRKVIHSGIAVPELAELAESEGITISSDESWLLIKKLTARMPLDLFIPNPQRIKTFKQPAIPRKVIYSGIAVPGLFPEQFPDLVRKGRWCASHITLHFGTRVAPELPEGRRVFVTVHGYYAVDTLTGLLVTLPWDQQLRHITLATAPGTKPVESNTLLASLFGHQPKITDIGRTVPSVTWRQPYVLIGYTGNYCQ